MDKSVTQERVVATRSGGTSIAMGLALLLLAVGVVWASRSGWGVFVGVLLLLAGLWQLIGLYMLQPNQVVLLMWFGRYAGTDRGEGLRWANPLYTRRKLSVRAHNFNSEKLKVNDLRGNPIEIAAAIVWRVEDSARASFDVEDFEAYVRTQAEAAVRHLASSFAYDTLDEPGAHASKEVTLRSGADVVAAALRDELRERFAMAGISVVDAKLTHLAYAPEIAGTMLRRQQAEAVVAARAKIVEGAVGMVELALHGLTQRGLVDLDDERKAAMVSNLLVVLCSDRETQPVVNTGTLYA